MLAGWVGGGVAGRGAWTDWNTGCGLAVAAGFAPAAAEFVTA